MNKILESPLFGIVICVLAYQAALMINRKLKSAVANPLMIAIVLIIAFLQIFQIPLEKFQIGSNFINTLLGPVTALLAITIYRQFAILKKNFWPVCIGCFTGSLASMSSAYLLCRLFKLDSTMTASLIPKSVTTPIAIEVSKSLNGIASITVAAVVITGIIGAIFAPLLVKVFRVNNPVCVGVAIGTSSHALGTTRAIEMGEIEGAMSGVAIGVAGIITVFLSLLL